MTTNDNFTIELLSTLKRLLSAPAFNLDDLEDEDIAAIHQAVSLINYIEDK